MTVKKIVWSMISILMVSMLLVVACSDDNNDSSIVGAWEINYDGGKDVLRFNSDGTFTEQDGGDPELYTGKYSISGDTLTQVYDGETKEHVSKFTVSSSELCIIYNPNSPTGKVCYEKA